MNETTINIDETGVATVVPTTPEPTVKVKTVKTLNVCWCGCGGTTKSKFVPGHDARFHGLAKKVARGEADLETELAKLPHDEARDEFSEHVEKERPIAKAKADAKARETARKDQEKAAKDAAKAAAKAAAAEPVGAA